MFPLRDENPTTLVPVLTILLIAGNVASWFLLQGAGMSLPVLAESVCRFGAIPAELTGRIGGEVVALGEGLPPCEPGGLRWGAVLSSMFMHGSWMHLITNMWFLWIFGNNIEDSMGHTRFAVFYLLCGIAAVGAQVAAAPGSTVPMVGASGAISGVMGAYLLLYPHVRIHTLFVFIIFIRVIAVPAWFILALWFGLQVLSGYITPVNDGAGGVAFWAHVGGFVAGLVLGKLFKKPELVQARKRGGGMRVAPADRRGWY